MKAEKNLDGKYLLSTSDDSLRPQEVALGYKQLMEVERAFELSRPLWSFDPFTIVRRNGFRPMASLFPCFALGAHSGATNREHWDQIRAVMERMHLGEFESKDGRILQRTELTHEQTNLLKLLNISPPPKIQKMDLAP